MSAKKMAKINTAVTRWYICTRSAGRLYSHTITDEHSNTLTPSLGNYFLVSASKRINGPMNLLSD